MTPQTSAHCANLIVAKLEGLGRWIVIDFGLAGLFDRFERTFGSFLTKLLLVLIGLAIAAACLSVIWKLVGPFLDWALPSGSPTVSDWERALSIVVNIIFLVLVAAIIASHLEGKIALRRYQEIIERFEQSLTGKYGVDSKEFERLGKALKKAKEDGTLEDFIKEHEDDPEGDLDKLDAVIKRPTRGSEKATPKASTPAPSDD